MGEVNNDVLFVYSELQISAANKIYNTRGKKFVCGIISVGNVHKKFTKMINPDKFDAMISQYADAYIVYKGNKSTDHYTNPTYENNN